MNTITIPTKTNKEDFLKAQTHIWTHIFTFLNSMALKCAIQLQIPDIIHNHGKPMTLNQLAQSLRLEPIKTTSLARITRLLVHSKYLTTTTQPNGEHTFTLTTNSQLLLRDHPMTLAPFALAMLDETLTEPAHNLSSWFRNLNRNGDSVESAESPFHVTHECGIWEYASGVPRFNELFNEAMASDAKFVSEVLVGDSEFKELFEGVGSFVDVGGGTGNLGKIISESYRGVKCIVLDLPHVIQGVKTYGLEFVGGDMFQAVPTADVALLKWILHDWSDDHCIKILERCKEAIPSKDKGGKVIIIDVVVDIQNENVNNSQLLFDMEMLSLTIGGKERTEEEWRQLFIKSGFNKYKILPILGSRSVIVVYPS